MKIYLTAMKGHEGPLLCADSWEEAERGASKLGLEIVAELPGLFPFNISSEKRTLH